MDIINPSGKKTLSVSTEWLGRKLTLEINRVGFRSTSSVLVRYGDTMVLGTVVVGKKPVEQDFFPLTVDYEEKFYAAGKISGSKFIKREGKPADEAILIGRLIDRPIRPLFPKNCRQEIQVVATVLSMDPAFRPDMIGMLAASSALMLSGTPFDGPIAGLRIGRINGEFKAFLTPEEREKSTLDLVVAAKDGKVMMVEAGAEEVPEAMIIEAMHWAVKNIQPALDLQRELRDQAGITPVDCEMQYSGEELAAQATVNKWLTGKLGANIRGNVVERSEKIDALRDAMNAEFAEQYGQGDTKEAKLADYATRLQKLYDAAFELAVNEDVRQGIIQDGTRPDGRTLTEIRPLTSQDRV